MNFKKGLSITESISTIGSCKSAHFMNSQYNKYLENSIENTRLKYLNNKSLTTNDLTLSPYQLCKTYWEDSNMEYFQFDLILNLFDDNITELNDLKQKNIYVYDFVSYVLLSLIDFKLIINQTNDNDEFIINFVSRQTSTFRIINIPDHVKIYLLVSFFISVLLYYSLIFIPNY